MDKQNDKDLLLWWLLSSVIDYIVYGVNICIMYLGYSTYRNEEYYWLRFIILLLQRTLATMLSIGRERIHYTLLGLRVSKFKIETGSKKTDPFNSVINHMKTIVLIMSGLFIFENYGLLWLDDTSFEVSFTF